LLLWEITTTITATLLGLIIFAYGSYYFYILRLISNWQKKTFDSEYHPKITVIVPTYNDSRTIKNKLVNLAEQTYGSEMMQIIAIDSASRDGTADIIRQFIANNSDINIKLIEEEQRRGKSIAVNKVLSIIDPEREIVIVTDADAFLKTDSVANIVACFSSRQVGAVVGRQVIPKADMSQKTAEAEGAYLDFYQKMREGESILDSTIIFDGELSGYRTTLVKNKRIRENLNADDSQLAMLIRRDGYKAIFEPTAVFYESLPTDRQNLRAQKVRRGQGLTRLFWYNKDILFNSSFGKFGTVVYPANFFMHIVSPVLILLIAVFGVVSVLLYLIQGGQFFLPIFLLIIFIAAIAADRLLPNKTKLSKIGSTFIQYQFILLEAMLKHLSGNSLHKWQKVQKNYTST
jgi:poly-beta-1,6-N-acetyl-D-glucosamine synthase